ncbi:MAG: acetylglutamate kinase [Hadesarchaea archaeon]|nr:acetylglutamate kinase [Hadesarchaea archaeon]
MQDRASILLEALPYIRRFHGKTLVLKIGGSVIESPKLLDSICQDVVLLNYVGMKAVLIHGGGPEITREMEKAGKKPKFIEGLRVTDEETMEILHKSLVGKVNKSIVLGLSKHGGRAVGISGIDGNLIRARKIKRGKVELGLVGEIEQIDPSMVNYLISTGYIPVIAPLGVDKTGTSLNLNADTVAAELAIAMKAEKLILLTDVPGVLTEPEKKDSLISHLPVKKAKELIESGTVKGGMVPKLRACIKAVENGAARAHIIDGTIPHALLLEVLTKGGIGTLIEPD